MKYRNYDGELVEAPEDYEKIVAKSEDGHSVVWSYDPEAREHQVRFHLGTRLFRQETDAATEFASAIRIKFASEGLY